MFSRIAYDGFLKNEILFSQADLEDRLKTYLVHVPEVPPAIDIDAETVLREIVEQHGIFVEQSRGVFSFAHLTFQEYYVAKYLAENAAPDVLTPAMACVADDNWREVFLLTASLLPDATSFLRTFEHVLHDLVAHRQRLISWLRWIDEMAALSHAEYSRTATRIWYSRTFDFDFDPDLSPDFVSYLHWVLEPHSDDVTTLQNDVVLARIIEQARTIALELAFDLDRNLPIDYALVSAYRHARRHNSLDLRKQLKHIKSMCQRAGNTTLKARLDASVAPPENASSEVWSKFEAELRDIMSATRGRFRYGQLESEIDEIIEIASARRKQPTGVMEKWYPERPEPLEGKDMAACGVYIRAYRLFYDCLQLAYTPDRRAFEDRILLPPPLTK